MRVATWNMAGRWSTDHAELLADLGADVLLLTEVSDQVQLSGWTIHPTRGQMAPRRAWAAVATRRPLTACDDPHPATAMAVVEGVTVASSILPWRSCGSREPCVGAHHAEKTQHTVTALLATFPRGSLMWGGDWNHALDGREWSGSIRGRRHLLRALDELDLQTPTATLPHQIDGLLSIDHVAVPCAARVSTAVRVEARRATRRLSDHDAYVVELADAVP